MPRAPLSSASRALLVGDPAASPELLGGRERLPAALAEAELARRRFPRSDLLTGDAATIPAFLRLAPRRRSSISAATPSSVPTSRRCRRCCSLRQRRPRTPARSTPATWRRSTSPASTWWCWRPVTPAVPAAAATTPRRAWRGPSWPAGVRSVLATLWPVDDRVTASFFAVFYRALAQHGDVAEAYARAVDSLRTSNDPELAAPASWGAFQLTAALAPPPPLSSANGS